MVKRYTIDTIHHRINTGKMTPGKNPPRQGFGTGPHLGGIHLKQPIKITETSNSRNPF
jgi:hypothetical protein